jgi:hypothetical protein
MMKSLLSFFIFLVLASAISAEQASTILVVRTIGATRLHKAQPKDVPSISSQTSAMSGLEQIEYRGYFINLQPSDKNYNLQIYTTIAYGNYRVNSIYASQFQSSIEYAYTYDAAKHEIRQDHFLFPANSLTGWANPDDYVLMRQFDWKERFPTNCDSSIYTSEEFGREYLEASCFQDRDAAVRFAKRFINYAVGRRGL